MITAGNSTVIHLTLVLWWWRTCLYEKHEELPVVFCRPLLVTGFSHNYRESLILLFSNYELFQWIPNPPETFRTDWSAWNVGLFHSVSFSLSMFHHGHRAVTEPLGSRRNSGDKIKQTCFITHQLCSLNWTERQFYLHHKPINLKSTVSCTECGSDWKTDPVHFQRYITTNHPPSQRRGTQWPMFITIAEVISSSVSSCSRIQKK